MYSSLSHGVGFTHVFHGLQVYVWDNSTLLRHTISCTTAIQVQYVIDHMAHREGLKPLADEGEDEGEEEEKDGGGSRPARRLLVVGAGAAGLAAASTLKVRTHAVMLQGLVWERAFRIVS